MSPFRCFTNHKKLEKEINHQKRITNQRLGSDRKKRKIKNIHKRRKEGGNSTQDKRDMEDIEGKRLRDQSGERKSEIPLL